MAGKRKYSDAEIVAALEQTKGLIFQAAGIVGCHADTIYERAKTSASITRALRNERGKVVDNAESKLFQALDEGEVWAVQFALRMLGKDRGYAERQEIEQVGTARVVIQEVELDDDDDGNPDGETAPGPG